MKYAAALFLAITGLSAQGPVVGGTSVDRQLASAERQRLRDQRQTDAVLARQGSSFDRQGASVTRQMASVNRQRQDAASWPGESFGSLGSTQPLATEPVSWSPGCDPLASGELNGVVDEHSRRNGLAPELLRAVIAQESGGRPCAVSSKGALGLMQLMPGTAEMLGVADPLNASQNVDGGSRYLRQLLDRYDGDLRLALGAYNAGPGRVTADLPRIPETQSYVSSILKALGVGKSTEPKPPVLWE